MYTPHHESGFFCGPSGRRGVIESRLGHPKHIGGLLQKVQLVGLDGIGSSSAADIEDKTFVNTFCDIAVADAGK